MTLSMETSCRFCPPGQRVIKHCNGTHDTVCGNCPPNTFSSQFALNTECMRCSPCKRREIVKHPCIPTKNSVCKCPPGYRYNPNKPCMKCPKGSMAVNDKCIPKKPPDREIKKSNDNNNVPIQNVNTEYALPIALSVLVSVIVIGLIILFIFCYKKRQQRRDHTQVKVDSEIPPEIPRKKGDYRYVNDYTPNPHMNLKRGLIKATPLSRDRFPGSVVDDLRKIFDGDDRRIAELANVLGYEKNECFLRKLRKNNDPIEYLINDYLTTSPTKESFYEALINIGYQDAADLIWKKIPPITSPKYHSRVVMT